jgi:Ion channel
MDALPTIALTLAGALLIALALRDVFDVLFHEAGRGVLSRGIVRGVWRLFRRFASGRDGVFTIAGPLALGAVIAVWAVLLIVGWALVYWPHLPDGFNFGSGVVSEGSLLDAFYVSVVTLSTLGFGDITPDTGALRVIAPLQALIGFGLLTASISWLLSIYPVLSRRRALAYEVNLLLGSEMTIGKSVLSLGAGSAEAIYAELTSRLVAVGRDLATFPVTYYFTEDDDRFSLPVAMPALLDLAERGVDHSLPARVRLRATMLREAVGDFAEFTARGFHSGSGTTEQLLDHYRRDHMR